MSDPKPTGLHSGETPLLQTVGLTKRYGDFLANESIGIDIWPRQIHALLGENGAGKSTLVKTIYGLIQPSDGEMRWRGEKMVLSGPSEARARGIGMVFQHFSLFDNLTVAENVALGLDGKELFKDMSARGEDRGGGAPRTPLLAVITPAPRCIRSGRAARRSAEKHRCCYPARTPKGSSGLSACSGR